LISPEAVLGLLGYQITGIQEAAGKDCDFGPACRAEILPGVQE
jgi:hypothetical protein